jgi:hypothetical protein
VRRRTQSCSRCSKRPTSRRADCHSLSAVGCMLSVACCLLHVACCLLHVVCCMLSVACCLLHVVCCMLSVACCLLNVACGLSHIARRRLAKTTKSRRLLPLPPPRLRHGGAPACRAAQRCLRTPMEPKEDDAIHSCYTGTRRDRVGQVHEAALCTHDDARQDVVSLHSVHKTE